ncbi:MAG: N-acetylmuramoyl-L-alanine amidase [Halochromatium sp.]|uniref:N-acetylmuramoyl-L-alanine amidase n=1 Tax=Halochromatium sp. TaxID=2049430 RepID=UPI00397D5A57
MLWMLARYSLLILLTGLSCSTLGGQVGVAGARMWSGPEYTRFVVDLAGPIEHRVFALDDPDRLVVDLVGARLEGALPEPTGEDRMVAGLRSGIRAGDDLRIVLDLKQPVRAKSFELAPNQDYGHRLVIDLSPQTEAADTRPSLPAPPPARRDLIIAVDAGHGGKDPGAVGPNGTREKDIVLVIARKLATRIDAHPGMRAVMVRDDDRFISLRQRIEIARKHRADLFVSIHADAFHDRRVRGSSVFTLSAGGATSEAARWIAERENRADLIGGVDLKQRDDLLASVLIEMSQNATIELSSVAAAKVLAKLQGLGEVHQQRIQQAGFAVLKSPDIPSMLVETAFISNPEEEKRLRETSYQNQLATAILEGIVEYFGEYPPPGTHFAESTPSALAKAATASAQQYRIRSGDTLSEIARNHDVNLSVLRDLNQLQGDQIRSGQVLIIPGS